MNTITKAIVAQKDAKRTGWAAQKRMMVFINTESVRVDRERVDAPQSQMAFSALAPTGRGKSVHPDGDRSKDAVDVSLELAERMTRERVLRLLLESSSLGKSPSPGYPSWQMPSGQT